jgi:hypothetical protein
MLYSRRRVLLKCGCYDLTDQKRHCGRELQSNGKMIPMRRKKTDAAEKRFVIVLLSFLR